MIVAGLAVTARHFFRNMRGFITGNRTTFVVQYPEKQLDFPDAFATDPKITQKGIGLVPEDFEDFWFNKRN